MDTGKPGPRPQRGRSKEAKDRTSKTINDKLEVTTTRRSESRKREQKKRPSRTNSKERRQDAKKRSEGTPRLEKDGKTRDKDMDSEGETGRKIKLEVMEERVQQKLHFSTPKGSGKDRSNEPDGRTPEGALVLYDVDGWRETVGKKGTTTGTGNTPKRKKDEVTKGSSRTSPRNKRHTPNERAKTRRMKGTTGRGGGARTTHMIDPPPQTKSVVLGKSGFSLETDYMKESHRNEREKGNEITESALVEQLQKSTIGKDLNNNGQEIETSTGGEEASQIGRTIETINDEDMEERASAKEMENKGREEEKDTDVTTKKTKEHATRTSVTMTPNPYKKPNSDTSQQEHNNTPPTSTQKENHKSNESTPVQGNKSYVPIAYAAATKSSQTKIRTHEKVMETHDSFYEISFFVRKMSNDPSIGEIRLELAAQLRSILMRAKEVDRKAKINAWDDRSDMPTLSRLEDIPLGTANLSAYISPNRQGVIPRRGRNSNWRIRITTRIGRAEFIHHWGLSKRDFTKTDFVTLRQAPMQAPNNHAAGYFLNSSDGQIVETLERELSKDLGHRISIVYKAAALDRRAANTFWKAANKAKYNAPEYDKNRMFFRMAPMVMQVYTETREQALKTAVVLSQKYGSLENRMYPRLPDGTRMRFVAAHVYLDMQGRSTAAGLFKQQVLFQQNEVTAQIPIRDPFQRFPSQGNKTMHELVMDIKDTTQKNEPYFKNMKQKFHWNFKTKEWEVNMHNGMYKNAVKILKNFKEYMTKLYGQEVGDAIMSTTEGTRQEFESASGVISTGISISTDDRYLNGDAQFIILGMENVADKGNTKTMEEVREGDGEEHTMNIRSTTSGMSGETGNTVPSARGIDDDSFDYESIEKELKTNRIQKIPASTEGSYESARDDIVMDETNDQDLTSNEGEWKTVQQGKGAKPRAATMMEKAYHYALSFSGSVGSGEGRRP